MNEKLKRLRVLQKVICVVFLALEVIAYGFIQTSLTVAFVLILIALPFGALLWFSEERAVKLGGHDD